jgi:hypothetical protein
MTHRRLLGAAAAAIFLALSAGTALANPRVVQSTWSHQRMTLPRAPDRVVRIKPLTPATRRTRLAIRRSASRRSSVSAASVSD